MSGYVIGKLRATNEKWRFSGEGGYMQIQMFRSIRPSVLVVAFLVSSWVSQRDTLAFRGGPPAAVDGSPAAFFTSCRACHGSTAGPGSVQVLNFPAQYQPNAVYNLIVRIADPTRSGAGFQASVQTSSGSPAGTIIRTDFSNTQLNSRTSPNLWRGIDHTGTGVGTASANWSLLGNAAEYSFNWQAPAGDVGPVTIWAAGNAINNNFSSSGDLIYLTSQTAAFEPIPTGACCDESSGVCSDNVQEANCQGIGERYGGDDSTCDHLDPPCTPIPGACCDEGSGQCEDGVFSADCQGRFGGPGSICGDIDPVCVAVPGACCDDLTGLCLDGLLEVDCGNRFGGPGSTCATISPVCVPPVGACCDGTDGGCADGLTESNCTGDQLDWTIGALCDDLNPPCAEHTGACCDQLNGVCTDDVPGSACVGTQMAWSKGAACADTTCDAAVGACCDHDPFGVCVDAVTLAACSCSNCEWVQDGSCESLDCAHASIPTVSEWGLVVLAILLLIGAKIGFRREPLGV